MSIDPNTILHVGYRGIVVATDVFSSGAATQLLQIDGNTIFDVHGQHIAIGIGVLNNVGDDTTSATMSQGLAITDNDVTSIAATATSGGAFAIGIGIANIAGLSSTITRSDLVSGNTVTSVVGATLDLGISNLNIAYSSATITQTLNLDHNSVTWIGGNQASSGVGAFAAAANGIANVNLALGADALISQGAHLDHNTVANVYAFFVANGIGNVNVAAGSNAAITQTASIDNNTVTSVAGFFLGAGVAIGANSGRANIVTFVSSSSNSGHAAGIELRTSLENSAAATQTINIAENTINNIAGPASNPYGVGIAVYNSAIGHSVLSQNLNISHNLVTGDPSGMTDGIRVVNYVSGPIGAVTRISQALSINGNQVSDVPDDRIDVRHVGA